MAWFSPFARDVVDLSPEELSVEAQPSGSILDRGRAGVSETLRKLRTSEHNLAEEIESRTERLRQTRVAIEAFEAAEKIMTEGDTDFAEVEAAPVIVHRHEAIQS